MIEDIGGIASDRDELPEQEWLCAGTIELMTEARAVGLPLAR